MPHGKMFNVCRSDALKEPAKSVTAAEAAHGKDFESFIKTLHAIIVNNKIKYVLTINNVNLKVHVTHVEDHMR